MDILSTVLSFWWVAAIALLLVGYKLVLRVFGIVMIPETKIGIVTKKFRLFGANRTLPDGALVALSGEAGVQADTLAPGAHFFLWPWQYDVDQVEFVNIEQGQLGVVEANDGKAVSSGRVLGVSVDCNTFQDARLFLTNGGQRGPQMSIIPPGKYRINTKLFSVARATATEINDTEVGVITAKDGKELIGGDIAGAEVPDHSDFQNGEAFIRAGGFRGLQEQVLRAGRYYLNPMFVTVETKSMTNVPIATAGVMISYVGEPGKDISGDAFKHGNLVGRGQKGVWHEPMDPGMYPINPLTHKLECVSTANIVLNWATGKTEAHNLDANLSTIKLRSSDGFALSMDVSVIIHIPRNDAPKVIQRFGTLQNLVTQVLEPLISNHFRNAAQKAGAIDFLISRAARQQEAKEAIHNALAEYNVVGVDALIGDIVPPAELMKTLTDRKIAEQEKVTFNMQTEAAEQRQKLEQATAKAATQARVVDAEREVTIAEFKATAAVKKAEGEATAKIAMSRGDAEAKTVNAKADAEVLQLVGNAEAAKETAVGTAQAQVIKMKTDAIGSSNYALIETAKAISKSGQALVPQILVAGGGKEGSSSDLVQVLVAKIARDGLNPPHENTTLTAPSTTVNGKAEASAS